VPLPLQGTLQRERVELATQLAKLTGVGSGARAALKVDWTAAGPAAAATRGLVSAARPRGSFGDDALRDERWMDDLKHLVEQASDAPEEDGGDLMLDKILNGLQRGGNESAVAAADTPTCREYRSAIPHPAGDGDAPVEAGTASWRRPSVLATSRRAGDGYEDAYPSPAESPSADGEYYSGYSSASTSGAFPAAPTKVLAQLLLPVPEGKCARPCGPPKDSPQEPSMSRGVPDSQPSGGCCALAPSSEESANKAQSARPNEYKCKRCGAPKKGHICSRERDGAREGARKEWSLQEDTHILNSVAEHGCRWRVIACSMHGRSDDAVRNRWNRLKDRIGLDGQPMDLGGEGVDDVPGSSREAELGGSPHVRRLLDMACPADRDPSRQTGFGGYHNATESRLLALDFTPGGHADVRMSAEALLPPRSLAPLPSTAMVMAILHPDGTVHSPRDGPGGERRKVDRVGWSPREDAIIASSVAEIGHRWYFIAQRLPGRTDHAIRNRWHRLQSMREEVQQRRIAQGEHELKQDEKLQLHRMPEHAQHAHYDPHLYAGDGGPPHELLTLPGGMDAPMLQAFATWPQ
jgi:hypothetical protein